MCEVENGYLSEGRRVSMSDIEYLRRKREAYRQEIYNKRQLITGYENTYDELINFKRSVENAYSDFVSVNSEKEKTLGMIVPVREKVKIAQNYYADMQNALKNIGNANVGKDFQVLIEQINKKMRECLNTISRYEGEISVINNRIIGLNNAITIAEQLKDKEKEKDE